MASQLRHVEVPVPWRMHTDSHSLNAPEGSSPFMYNVLPGNPREVRVRGQISRGNSILGFWGRKYFFGMNVIPAATAGGRPTTTMIASLVTLNTGDKVSNFEGMRNGYYTTQPGSVSNFPHTNITYPGGTIIDQNADVMYPVQFGRGVQTAFGTYVPVMMISGGNPEHTSVGLIAHGTTKLVGWGTTATNGSVNKGSSTVTLSGGATFTFTGKCVLYGDRASNWDGESYVATITSTKSATLYKPYGEGNNGLLRTTVSNYTGPIRVETISGNAAFGEPLIPDDPPMPIITDSQKLVVAVGMFRERLFAAYGWSDDRVNTRRIEWSVPGHYWFSRSTNYIIVPGNKDVVLTALAEIGETLLIMDSNSTYVLTGYDEDSFQLRQLSADVGCIHSSTLAWHGGRVYWCGYDGVYSSSGHDIREHTNAGGASIRDQYIDAIRRAGLFDPYGNSLTYIGISSPIAPRVYTAVQGDYLLLSVAHPVDGVVAPPLVMHIPTNSWAHWGRGETWGISTQGVQPEIIAASPISGSPIYMFDQVGALTCNDFANKAGASLEYNGAYEAPFYKAIKFPAVRFTAAETTRLKGLQYTHNCAINDIALPMVAWSVALDHDDNLETGDTDTPVTVTDTGDIPFHAHRAAPSHAHRVAPSGQAMPAPSGKAMPVLRHENAYITKHRNISFPTEGNTFRVTLTSTSNGFSGPGTSYDIQRVAFLVDQHPTMLGRTQD